MKDFLYQGFDEKQWTKLQESLKDPILIADGGDCYGHVQVGDCLFDISAYNAEAETGPVVLIDCYAPHNSDLEGDTMAPLGKAFAYDFYSEMEIVIPAAEALNYSFSKIKFHIEDCLTRKLQQKGNEWFLEQANIDSGFWKQFEIAKSLNAKIEYRPFYSVEYNSLQQNIIKNAGLTDKVPEVTFWLNEGYGPDGFETSEMSNRFTMKIAMFMRNRNYTVTLPPVGSAASPEADKWPNHLYCHPAQLSGHMNSEEILPLAVSLQNSGFHVTGISVMDDLYIGSTEWVEEAYDKHRKEIDELLVKAVKKYPFSAHEEVGKQIAIRLVESSSYIPEVPKFVEKYLKRELQFLEQVGILHKEQNGAYTVSPTKGKSVTR